MPSSDSALVDDIRTASRQMVRELGFMQSTLAATTYPPSFVHALLEIGARRTATAAHLSAHLGLEKSSVSRMIAKLVQAGEIAEAANPQDGRAKLLSLTGKGRRTYAAIQAYGRNQVRTALRQLDEPQRLAVREGLSAYAQALAAGRQGGSVPPAAAPAIVEGYQPGAIGRIAEMHACYYARANGFGAYFERQVAEGVAEFSTRLDEPRNGLWLAVHRGRIVASVAIDGAAGNHAHLRWFIVDDGLRGAGVGRCLLAQALAFCDAQGFETTYLWTFQGLDAARALYERAGFVLVEQAPGKRWGTEVVEQRFERPRCAPREGG